MVLPCQQPSIGLASDPGRYKNPETKKFIAQIKPEMTGIQEEEDRSANSKELAKKEGLMVKEGGEPRS